MTLTKRLALVVTAATLIIPTQLALNAAALSHNRLDEFAQNGILFYDPDMRACTTVATGNPIASGDIKQWLEQYGEIAMNVQRHELYGGIPYEAMLAQSILESGWGKSSLASQHNNFFGIKYNNMPTDPDVAPSGSVVLGTSEEYTPGVHTPTDAAFATWDSPAKGFLGYGAWIHRQTRYAEALNYPNNPVAYITAIKEAGYATDSNYVAKNVQLINQIQSGIRQYFPTWPSSEMIAQEVGQRFQPWSDGCFSGGLMAGGFPTVEAAEAAFKVYDTNNGYADDGTDLLTPYRGVNGIKNCTAFSAWFINKYTTAQPASGDGRAVVGQLLARNPGMSNNDQPGTQPRPYAIFSIDRGDHGHTGVIAGVDTTRGVVIIADAAWPTRGLKVYEQPLSDYVAHNITYFYPEFKPEYAGGMGISL